MTSRLRLFLKFFVFSFGNHTTPHQQHLIVYDEHLNWPVLREMLICRIQVRSNLLIRITHYEKTQIIKINESK